MRTLRLREVRRSALELVGRPSVESDHCDGVGRKTPAGQQQTGSLGQDPGLPRPGGGDDPRSTTRVQNRCELIGGKLGGRPIVPEGLEKPMLDRNSMEDRHPDPARKLDVDRARRRR